jgi:methyl-accepting chemotaxis protein
LRTEPITSANGTGERLVGAPAAIHEPRPSAPPLRAQLLLTLALLTAGPVIVLGIVQAKLAEDAEAGRADRETLLASTSLARELGRIIEAQANVARSLASEVGNQGSVDAKLVGGKTERYLRSFSGLYGVYVLDHHGVTIEGTVWKDGATQSTAGTSYGDRHWFHEILEGAPFASELLLSRTTNRPGVILIAPIFDTSHTFRGVIGAGVDLDGVQSALERVGDAAPGLAAVVVDQSGRVVAATRSSRAKPLEPLGDLALYRPAAGHSPDARTGADESGVARRGTVATVESSVVGWSVITSWPQAAVQQRKLHALLTMCGFAAGAFVVGLAAALLLARQLAQPVARLSSLVDAIGRGDLRSVTRRQDRLSPGELVELEQSIAGMLSRLKSVIVQLGQTVIAVRKMTRRLHDASGQMLVDSHAQQEAVRKSSSSIVQINDAISSVGGSVRSLSDTALQTASSITGLNRQIDQIADNLTTLGATIASALQHVEGMEQQVSAIANNASQLGESVGHTGHSLRELTQSIRGVADRAEHGRVLARNALSAAVAGQAAVEETIEATHETQRRFSVIEEAVRSLVGRSEAIGEVASIIDEVMRAIRVLGINAAIIASAAGEHGKAFGVVADRVRSMAAETGEAIDKITKLVASVRSDILRVVEVMQHGQQIVMVGGARSVEAGVRLRAIIESSAEAEQTTKEIAAATQDQAKGVSVVLEALEEVRKATDHIRAAAETQRQTQQAMGAAIGHVRAVGDEVRESTRAQQAQSEAMTSGVRAMTTRFQAIAESVEAQSQDRARIEACLTVFEGASRSSVERARQIGEVVDALSERLEQLERELGSFRVD